MTTTIATATEILSQVRPSSAAAYRQAAERHWARRGLRPQPQADPLRVHINCGRWVTPCPCGGGIAATPGWAYAACFDCGRWWAEVVFPPPALLAALDAVLRLRPAGRSTDPLRWYSWVPGESVEALEAQNMSHGWPLPALPITGEV